MIDKSILHYKILAKLGEGGMGVVYKALDTELEREVAIKFLPRHIASNDDERERFRIEAKAAAALNHANIATIHAIEKTDDETFIVMEYIDGQELKNKIDTGPLPIDDVLDIGIQIAGGLQAAHEKGVVHRDIKSANVMLTNKGDVKIMDFGLAKLGSQNQITQAGTTLGTAAYMSPEQTKGEDVDQRSDIFSLGVLLYEMVTGVQPFKGDYEQAVTYAILSEDQAPITGVRTGVPMELERIVNKCLKKDAGERYQRVDELIVDLKSLRGDSISRSRSSVAAAPVQPAPKSRLGLYVGLAIVAIILAGFGLYFFNQDDAGDSIAVLPFVNAGNDPELEYLSDGITETLISKLSQLPQLQVMARSTVFQFKGTHKTPQEIGRELGVRAVLIGEIRQRGEVLRLNAELMDVTKGTQIWGDQYDRTTDDIFDIQDAISGQISASLAPRLSSNERDRLTKRETNSTEAYQLYLKGRFFWNKRRGEDLITAMSYFEQAVQIDPNYALAHAGIAECYSVFTWYGVLPSTQAYPKAKEAAQRALELDDQLGEAYAALAQVNSYYDWDFEAAQRNYLKAIAVNPSYATAHQWYGEDLSYRGFYDEGITELKQALALDPLSLIINATYGWMLGMAGRYEEGRSHLQKTIEMDQSFHMSHYLFGNMEVKAGRLHEAILYFREGHRLTQDVGMATVLAHALAVSGDKDFANQLLRDFDERAAQDPVSPYHYAMIHTGLGNTDKAMEYFQLAVEQRDHQLILLKIEPLWDSLRSDPRFVEMLRTVGLEP